MAKSYHVDDLVIIQAMRLIEVTATKGDRGEPALHPVNTASRSVRPVEAKRRGAVAPHPGSGDT